MVVKVVKTDFGGRGGGGLRKGVKKKKKRFYSGMIAIGKPQKETGIDSKYNRKKGAFQGGPGWGL